MICCAQAVPPAVKGMASRDGWHIAHDHKHDVALGTCSLHGLLQDSVWSKSGALQGSGTLRSSVPEQPPTRFSCVAPEPDISALHNEAMHVISASQMQQLGDITESPRQAHLTTVEGGAASAEHGHGRVGAEGAASAAHPTQSQPARLCPCRPQCCAQAVLLGLPDWHGALQALL